VRIAFYAPLKPPSHPTPSGDRRVARLIMTALARGGHQVELGSRFRSFDGGGDARRQARLAALGAVLARRLIRRYRARPKSARPEAWFTYHLYYKAPDWLGPAISAALDIPYVIAEASDAPKRTGGLWDIGHRSIAPSLAEAAAVFVMNPNDRACIEGHLASPDRLFMLPPFLDPKPYEMSDDRTAMRAKLAAEHGLHPTQPWLLAVGMMRAGDKLASYHRIGAALTRVADKPWQLLVVGDGPARAAVEAALAVIDGARVFHFGELPSAALARLYRIADIMIWPAVREAYGMALLEAQASGLPVIAGNTGGVPAIVVDGKTGLLVDPDNAPAFADAVASLIADPKKRAAMGRNAWQNVHDNHSVDGAAAILNKALESAGAVEEEAR
jgi:glycosyltransferase involved in cell wall biosynthesis